MNIWKMNKMIKPLVECCLLASLLVVVSCSKKKKSSPKVEEPLAVTYEYWPVDEHEHLFYMTEDRAMLRSTDFPDNDWTAIVMYLDDQSVAFLFPLIDQSAGTDMMQSIVYRLTDDGKWEYCSSLGAWGVGENKIDGWLIDGLEPDSEVILRLVWASKPLTPKWTSADYNTKIVRFRTLPYATVDTVSVTVGGKKYSSVAATESNITVSVESYPQKELPVKIYADSACTDLVGEASTVTPLELNLSTPGVYNFYVTMTNELGNVSPCSKVHASYTLLDCPEDYVPVQPKPSLDTPGFCLMKTEARRGANDVAVPGYSEYPWEATPQEAKDACRRVGPNCDVITNLEWMAVAEQIASINSNKKYVGGNYIRNTGHTLAELGVLNISDPEDEFDQLNTDSFVNRRTFNLLMGTLWDFGGNLAEWADNAVVGGEVFQPITNTCAQGPFEITDANFTCPALDSRYFKSWSIVERNNIPTHANNYIGRIVGPTPEDQNSAVPLAAARGGHHDDLINSGIFSLFMFNHMTDTAGFRCVCH